MTLLWKKTVSIILELNLFKKSNLKGDREGFSRQGHTLDLNAFCPPCPTPVVFKNIQL